MTGLRQSWCAGYPPHVISEWDSSSHTRKWATGSHLSSSNSWACHQTSRMTSCAPSGPAAFHHRYKRSWPGGLMALKMRLPTSRTKSARLPPSRPQRAFRLPLPTTQLVYWNALRSSRPRSPHCGYNRQTATRSPEYATVRRPEAVAAKPPTTLRKPTTFAGTTGNSGTKPGNKPHRASTSGRGTPASRGTRVNRRTPTSRQTPTRKTPPAEVDGG